MHSILVKDLMVPASEYVTISEDDTLYDVVVALDNAAEQFRKEDYRHRAVLVYDKNNKITGKVSHLDVLRALEPKYEQIGEESPVARFALSSFGLGKDFLQSLRRHYSLLERPMEDICRSAGKKLRVKNFMYTPAEGECVNAGASLNEAVHQLVIGHHQSLLVTENDQIIGILKLSDVFNKISQITMSCFQTS